MPLRVTAALPLDGGVHEGLPVGYTKPLRMTDTSAVQWLLTFTLIAKCSGKTRRLWRLLNSTGDRSVPISSLVNQLNLFIIK